MVRYNSNRRIRKLYPKSSKIRRNIRHKRGGSKEELKKEVLSSVKTFMGKNLKKFVNIYDSKNKDSQQIKNDFNDAANSCIRALNELKNEINNLDSIKNGGKLQKFQKGGMDPFYAAEPVMYPFMILVSMALIAGSIWASRQPERARQGSGFVGLSTNNGGPDPYHSNA